MTTFILDNLTNIIILLILLVLSGCFSGSETALFSLNPVDLNKLRRSGKLASSAVLSLHQHLPDFLLTVLLGNMILNILFFSISGMLTLSIQKTYGHAQAASFGLFALFTLILCGEVTPKTVATATRYHFAMLSAIPMLALHKTVAPIRYILRKILTIIERMINFNPQSADGGDDLKILLELGQNRGDLSREESQLLSSVIELPDITASEMMTPRVDVSYINSLALREEALEAATRFGHSKLLLRESESEEFTGWIDAREAFFNIEDGQPVESIKRRLLVLSEFDRADQILARFMQTRFGLALIVDERGSATGILALSDLAEEIFGELGDEDARPMELISCDGPGAYIIDGSLSIREWNNQSGQDISLPGISTMGGLVTAILDRQAKAGDIAEIEDIKIEVLKLRKHRPGKLRISTNTYEEDVEC